MFKPIRFTAYIILIFLICSVYAYKQFQLKRTSLNEQSSKPCTSTERSQQAFNQICYYKDISYHTQIFIDQIIYYVSMDLTIPYSWLKSPDCKNPQNNNCHIIQNQQKKEAQHFFKNIKTKYNLFSRYRQSNNQKVVAIAGSSDMIIGQIQEVSYGQIYAKDSKNSKYLSRLIGISLFVTSQKDKISLRDISLIKAKKISHQLNGMIDGAISIKPTRNNSNSLLQQLFIGSQSSQRMVTIFIYPLSKSGVISIGDLSLKHSKSKTSQIIWVQMKDNAKYGQFTLASAVILGFSNEKYRKISKKPIVLNFTKNLFYTISSSFIYLPRDCLDWLIQSLQEQTNAICELPQESGVFKCEWKNIQNKKKALYMKLSLSLGNKQQVNIPFTTLIKVSNDLYMQFTIRQSLLPDQILLGQPFFQEYLVFIDYKDYKIGFAQPFYHQSDKYSTILIYFLRFILFATIILFLLYICWRPFNKIKRFLQVKLNKRVKGSRLSQNLYEEDFLQ